MVHYCIGAIDFCNSGSVGVGCGVFICKTVLPTNAGGWRGSGAGLNILVGCGWFGESGAMLNILVVCG